MEYFITDIEIKKIRHVENFVIPLSKERRKHLLITGKNGSGKTSVLEGIEEYLNGLYSGDILELFNWNSNKSYWQSQMRQAENAMKDTTEQVYRMELERTKAQALEQIGYLDEKLAKYDPVQVSFSTTDELVSETKAGRFILTFFGATRNLSMTIPSGISKVDFDKAYSPKERIAEVFLQYLVYLKTQQAFAITEGNQVESGKIQNWFERLQEQLRELFEDDQLKLEFESRSLNFTLKLEDKREPFDFSTLSAGHTAYLEIVSELIMRMEKNDVSSYDLQGIVLIDEIETHLHVSLQKKILPFLTTLFPKIQFIVTTHSPFVLNSIPDTIICDLENRTVMEDFSAYSYESIVEKYFGAEQYSQEIQEKMNEYIRLMQKHELSTPEELDLDQLRTYLNSIPYNMAPEVKIKFNQLELDRESEKL